MMTESDRENIMPWELYVATDGNDEWSGTLAEPSADQSDGPLATLAEAARRLRRAEPPTKALGKALEKKRTVHIRGGVYTLRETFVLGRRDAYTTYKAYENEAPVLTSAVRITDWNRVTERLDRLPAQAQGKVWCADLPADVGCFRTLYDGNTRLPRARTAPFELKDVATRETANILEDDTHSRLCFPQGFIKNWDNLADVEVYVRTRHWNVNYLGLTSVNERESDAITSVPASYPLTRDASPGLVHLDNTLEGMAAPGCWCVDTRERKVYLWPVGDEPSDAIAFPSLSELVRVEGDVDPEGQVDTPVFGIDFCGITFECAERDVWTEADATIQHDWVTIDKGDACIRFRGAQICRVENCTFQHSSGHAVRLDLHCQECYVLGNTIRHMGQGGINLVGYGPGTKDVNKYNGIVNNHIHHCGEVVPHSHGIVLSQSGSNRVAHNSIHHMPRKGICLCGVRFSYFSKPDNPILECARVLPDQRLQPTRECGKSIRWAEIEETQDWRELSTYLHTRDNRIEFNDVSRCLEQLGDGAAINISGAGTGNVLRRNYVHDLRPTRAAAAFRVDDYQLGTVITENVIRQSTIKAYVGKHENEFSNNIIIDALPKEFIRLRRQWGPYEHARLCRNIMISTKQRARFYSTGPYDLITLTSAEVDRNIYFNAEQPEERTPDLEILQEHGHDTLSLLEDPKLMDIEGEDYRLSQDSPARELGIASIDIRPAGLLPTHRDYGWQNDEHE